MDSGYYAACAGLLARTQTLELAANNLANVNTVGYRAHRPSFHSLLAAQAGGTLLSPLNQAVNDFGVLSGSSLDLASGNLEHTGNDLDLAIEGQGFFAIQTAAGVRYTRNGNFALSARDQLITAQGDPVLGEQGSITLPPGKAAVGTDGSFSVNGAVAGKLRVVEFAPGTELLAEGGSYYIAPKGSAKTSSNSAVRQGMLEASNVNPVAATVELITVQREAEMLQRALFTFHNDLNQAAATQLARVP